MFKKFPTLLFLFACLFTLSSFALASSNNIGIDFPSQLSPFEEKEFTLQLPTNGSLDIQIDDGINGPHPIIKKQVVQSGTFSFNYDGLIEGDIPLKEGSYTIHAQLLYDDQFISASTEIKITDAKTTLLYAIPSSKQLSQGNDNWFIDCGINGKGNITADFYLNNNKVHSFTTKIKEADTYQIVWDGKVDGAYVPEGNYECQVYLQEKPDHIYSFPVDIFSTLPPLFSLEETSPLVPEQVDDQSLWSALQAPVTVIEGSGDGCPVLEFGDPNSKSIGTVYFDVQGVQVISLSQSETMAYIGAYRIEDGTFVKGYVPKNKLKTISSSSEYGLVIDKNAQQLRVYYQGRPLGNLAVSTGLMEKSHLNYETPAGSFFISGKQLEKKQNKTVYDYVLTINDDLFISQIGYTLSKKMPDFEASYSALGSKATTGSIAADYRLTDSSINAYWLLTNIPIGTKVIVIDDEQARARRIIEIYPDNYDEYVYTPSNLTLTTPNGLTDEALQAYDQVLLSFAGDCVLGGEEKSRKDSRSFDNVVAEKGYAWPFSGLVDLFSQDDMTVVNLEVVLQDHKKGMLSDKIHIFRGATAYTEILQLGSVEQVNIANNHYIDYGNSGKTSTQDALNQASIPFSGFEHLYIFEKNGYKIGFSGIRETVYRQDKSIMASDISKLQKAGCDVIIYACHFGNEYERNHNELQTIMAHRAIDLGANIVIGHHTHVVQGIEGYNGGVIFYGLGNFVFGGNLDLTEFDALVAQTNLLFKNNRYQGVQVSLHPVLTTGIMPANDFRPIPATGEDRARILQKIQNDTTFALNDVMFFPKEVE